MLSGYERNGEMGSDGGGCHHRQHVVVIGGKTNTGGDHAGRWETENHRDNSGEEKRQLEEGKKNDPELQSSTTLVVYEGKKDGNAPPNDDCCPICFGSFILACKTNCGHWFCANCILQLWNYRQALHKCKCPICSGPISTLTPEAASLRLQDAEAIEVLKKVDSYNRLFQGGVYGFMRQALASPVVIKRLLWALTDPGRFGANYWGLRVVAMLISCLYHLSKFDFTIAGYVSTRWALEMVIMTLVVIFGLIGLVRRFILRRRVRRFAAARVHV